MVNPDLSWCQVQPLSRSSRNFQKFPCNLWLPGTLKFFQEKFKISLKIGQESKLVEICQKYRNWSTDIKVNKDQFFFSNSKQLLIIILSISRNFNHVESSFYYQIIFAKFSQISVSLVLNFEMGLMTCSMFKLCIYTAVWYLGRCYKVKVLKVLDLIEP